MHECLNTEPRSRYDKPRIGLIELGARGSCEPLARKPRAEVVGGADVSGKPWQISRTGWAVTFSPLGVRES